MRVAFIGVDHEFSISPLRAIAREFTVVGVVESLPGEQASPASCIKSFAAQHGTPYTQIGRGRPRPAAFLKSLEADIICVSGMAGLLREDEFTAATLGAINLHPSLLPAYRGPEPFFWQAHAADLNGGVTVHRIDAGIDTGDILVQRPIAIHLGMRFGDIRKSAIDAGADALCQAIEALQRNTVHAIPQRSQTCPFYARRVLPEDMILDWSWPAERLWHFLRAVPYERRPIFPRPSHGNGWSIGELNMTPSSATAGTIARDTAGWYLAHPQGRIRLQPQAGRMKRVLRRMRSMVIGT